MTDLEIAQFLAKLKPENNAQALAIEKAIKCFSAGAKTLVEYFSGVAYDEIESKASDVIYNHYCKWCADNGYMFESKIAMGKYIFEKYQLVGKQERVNGRLKTVYKKQLFD